MVALSGLTLAITAMMSAGTASAVTGPVVTLEDGTSGCNGVTTTPGSENTTKTLIGGSMQPGETAIFKIEYPVDADDVGDTFTITDCVFINGDAAQKYSISFVPNNTAYELTYSIVIPEGTAIGAEYCNYAKTTAGPSASQASNRKANPACFNVGGSLRIEKRAGSAEGDLLPGAQFTVDCPTEVAVPPIVVDGLDEDGIATTGVIGINGPEGTVCTVTEVAAPEGYELADDASRQLTIPRGSTADTEVFVNTASECTEDCVEPTETPTPEPTESVQPTVEPSDPAPSISPTVKGVKIVKPPQTLPHTGAAATTALLALGLGLAVSGGAIVVATSRYQRQH